MTPPCAAVNSRRHHRAPPGPGQDVLGQRGGDRAVPDDLGRLPGAGFGQRGRGDDDRHLGLHVGGGGLPGDPFHQGVGHDLVAAALIAGVLDRVGVRP
jgi:hypothetical protein